LIAAILLLLDLSQEPGSGVTFASLSDSDSDSDTVSELCTKENFSWSVAAAVEDEAPSARDVVQGSPLFEQRHSGSSTLALSTQRTSAAQSFDIPQATVIVAAVRDLQPLDRDGSVHRNTALAHKRDVVLIV